MSTVKNLKIGNTTYNVRDGNTYRSLSSAQATTLLSNGTYDGVDVESGEIFTCDDGAIKQYTSTSTYDADFTTGGKVTITDGVATFGSGGLGGAIFSDYTFNPSSNTWKVRFSITPGITAADYEQILGFGSVGISEAASGKRIHLYISGITDSYGQTALTNGVKYDLELSFTGTEYVLKIKESTAIEWTTDITVSSSSTVSSGAFIIGAEYKYGSYFNFWKGSIDLNDFTAEINNEVVWTPYEDVYTRTLTTLAGIKLTDITQAGTGIRFVTEATQNFTAVGNITINDKVASSFDGYGYIQLPDTFPASVTSFDFITKASLTSTTNDCVLFGRVAETGGSFYVSSSNKFCCWDGANHEGTNTLSLSTDYWFRIVCSGGTWYGYTLEDDNYTLETLPDISQWRQEYSTANGGNILLNKQMCLGCEPQSPSHNNYWKGSIDLGNTVIDIDGSNWWTPYETATKPAITCDVELTDIAQAGTGIKLKEDDIIHYTLSGTPTVSSDYIASNFSETDKIYPAMVGFPYSQFQQLAYNQPWEFKTKIRMDTVGVYNYIFGGICGSWNCDLFVNESNKVAMNLSSTGGGYDLADGIAGTTSLEANTDYWIKCGWTGTKYYAEISTDGINWTDGELSLTSSTGVYPSGWETYIGARCGGYFHGSIDLSETSFDFNNGEHKWSVVEVGEDAITLDFANGGAAPDSSTVGYIGKVYVDSANGDAYICVGISGSTYTWKKITP